MVRASTSRWKPSACRRTFDLCTRIVKPGGTVANIGVHGAPTTLHLEDLWIKNITITTGLVSGSTVPTLLALARDGRIAAEKLGTPSLPAR
jgi:alcohol dehydrogenase